MSLCKTCLSFTYVRFTNNKEYAYCSEMGERVSAPVVKCNAYHDKSRGMLEKMAWILEKKNKIGIDTTVFEFEKPKSGQEGPHFGL